VTKRWALLGIPQSRDLGLLDAFNVPHAAIDDTLTLNLLITRKQRVLDRLSPVADDCSMQSPMRKKQLGHSFAWIGSTSASRGPI
jgi:hypothetical protein